MLAFLISQNVRGLDQKYLHGLFAAGLLIFALSVILDQARWQMMPGYLLFAILSPLLLRRSYSHIAVRSIGVLFGILFVGVSVVLSLALPIVALPAPSGPHIVGSTSFSLFDETRDNSLFGASGEDRELYVQAWYPGTIEQDQPESRVKTLWQELYRGDQDVWTLINGYMRGMKTHSFEDIRLSAAQPSYPVLIFSHGLGLLAEQNTILMEHLASHGYVVFGVGHTYMSLRVVASDGRSIPPDFDKLFEATGQSGVVERELESRFEQASSPEESSTLLLEYYERSTGLNELMAIWVDDLRFVLDTIYSYSGRSPELQAFTGRISTDRMGLLGMSFGGGAITELCKIDTRCRAGLNLDGGTFGQYQRQPLRTPFLMLTSSVNKKYFEYLLPASESDFYEITVEGAGHLDFLDAALIAPFLKWLNTDTSGSIAGKRIIEITNEVSLRFFDGYLRDGPRPRFSVEDFPELTVKMNDHARE